jgi:hypothetical protein
MPWTRVLVVPGIHIRAIVACDNGAPVSSRNKR